MFGGTGFYSDLWKYEISINHWTKMKGPALMNAPVLHGIIGQEDTMNNPAACEYSVGWTDANNNLWMFGGDFEHGDNWGDQIYINYSDLWKFNISTNNWIWMGDSIGGPSGRSCFAHWSDSDHNLWLFGGTIVPDWLVNCNYCGNGTTIGVTDLWKYDINTNQWLQSNLPSQNNYYFYYHYPQTCSTDDTLPPGTDFNTAFWNRSCDNMEFYGGLNYTYDDESGGEWLLDTNMWDYNVNTNQWTLMSKGANFPSNGEHAIGWSDNSGNLWLFGGGWTASNYMWEYIPDSTCPSILNTYPVHCSFYTNDTIGCNPLSVLFQSTSTNAINYLWVFGDGDSSTVANPVHIYTTSGTFTVKLYVYNPLICSNTQDSLIIANYITVSDSVHAGFFADSLVGCNPLTVIFINQSYNAVGYYWDFGDGSTSTNVNPIHIYDSIGMFTVRLIAYGTGVCNDTAVDNNLITIGAICRSGFHAVDTIRCDSVHFINTSVNGTSFKWYFGDGDSSNVTNPAHLYTDTGYYSVTLISYYDGICGSSSDTMTRVNYINRPSYINGLNFSPATAGDTVGCVPFTATFFQNFNSGNSYLWEFGNGDTSTNHTYYTNEIYNNSGVYTVTLIGYNTYNGCNDTTIHQNIITVYPVPVPAIIIQHGDTLFSSDSTNNEWYWNNLVYLSSNNSIVVSASGCYYLRHINSYGCESSADSVCFNFTGINEIEVNNKASIYPNPNDGNFILSYSHLLTSNSQFAIKDILGRTVKTYEIIGKIGNETIDISNLSNGIYFYQVINEKEIVSGKFMKE
jgi:PKD repeat protein